MRAAKAAGAALSVETCFHYLAFRAEHIPAGRPEFKCCPPIRDDANRAALWAALLDGTINFVVSDHSPCVATLKRCDDGDIMAAWGGISTLGLGLSVLWTEGRKRGASIGRIVEWTCVNTARHASLDMQKGKIAVGYDADIIVWDPDTEFKVRRVQHELPPVRSHNSAMQVTKESLNFKNKLSPYEGLTLSGVVEKTFLRGQLVYNRVTGGFANLKPCGKLL